MKYEEVDTKLLIHEIEVPCTFCFEVDGDDDVVMILSAVIEPTKDILCDLFTPRFDWLLRNNVIINALEDDAREYIKAEETKHKELELDNRINAAREAA